MTFAQWERLDILLAIPSDMLTAAQARELQQLQDKAADDDAENEGVVRD